MRDRIVCPHPEERLCSECISHHPLEERGPVCINSFAIRCKVVHIDICMHISCRDCAADQNPYYNYPNAIPEKER